jgi:hypothetical protein
MSRVRGGLVAVGSELLGLLIDDWRLAGGIAVILGGGWWAVSRGAGGITGYVIAVAIAVLLAGVAVVEGRSRGRRPPSLDSKAGGRIPDRDP